MKKLLILSILFIFSFCKTQENIENPEEYLHKIEIIHDEMTDAVYTIDSLIGSYNFTPQQYNDSYKKFLKLFQKAQKTLKSMKSFQGNKKLLFATLNYIEELKNITESNYSELANLYEKPFDSWTEDDFNKMYDLLEKIDNKIYDKENVYQQKYQEFVENYL